MALDLGTLAATLKVNDSQLVSGLRQAESKAKAAGTRIGDNVASGAKPGLAKLGTLLGGLGIGYMGAQMLGFGFKTAMGMEKAEISFTTMLGSASKAQAFIGKMKEFAATTPFEFPELQTAAGKLMAAGIATDKVIPIMTTLGNVTSGMGTGSEGVNRATVALQQMNAAGKITAEDLNQLRDAGVPVYDLLAAATGKSTAQIAKMASTGKLGKKELDAMMKALETGKGLEKFGGLMEAQSKSLEGTISTMKDNLGQGLAGALEPLMPFIKDGIGALSAALPGLGAGLKDFINNLIGFGQWVQDNKLWLGQFAVTVGVLVIGLAALGLAQAVVAAGGFVAFVTQAMNGVKAWAVVQWLLNAAMNANPISLIVIAIAALVAGLIYAYNTSTEFRNACNTAFAAVGEAGRWLWNNALAPVVRFIVNGFASIVDGIAGMLEALGNIPGFGWAKDAAVKMRETAAQARAIASGIKDIPKKTTVSVTVDTKWIGASKAELNKIWNNQGTTRNYVKAPQRASGGPVAAGGMYLVGEEGPELVRFQNDGMVFNNRETNRMLSGVGTATATRSAPASAAAPLSIDDIAEGMRRALAGASFALSGGDRFLNQLSAVIVDDMARGVS